MGPPAEASRSDDPCGRRGAHVCARQLGTACCSAWLACWCACWCACSGASCLLLPWRTSTAARAAARECPLRPTQTRTRTPQSFRASESTERRSCTRHSLPGPRRALSARPLCARSRSRPLAGFWQHGDRRLGRNAGRRRVCVKLSCPGDALTHLPLSSRIPFFLVAMQARGGPHRSQPSTRKTGLPRRSPRRASRPSDRRSGPTPWPSRPRPPRVAIPARRLGPSAGPLGRAR